MQGEKVAKFEKVDFLEKFQKKNFSRSIVERIRLYLLAPILAT